MYIACYSSSFLITNASTSGQRNDYTQRSNYAEVEENVRLRAGCARPRVATAIAADRSGATATPQRVRTAHKTEKE